MPIRDQLTALLSLLIAGHVFVGRAHANVQDESLLVGEMARLNNQSLLWGPYRPNLYFGVRPRLPKSIQTALMWAKVDDYNDVQNSKPTSITHSARSTSMILTSSTIAFRYTCEQNEMAGYGWEEYDTRKGGIQTMHDTQNKIDITTSFVKIPGGGHGGSWAARIKGEPREDAPEGLKTTVVFYVTSEPRWDEIEVTSEGDEHGFDHDVALGGSSEALGDWKIVVTKGTGDHPQSGHPISNKRDLEKTVVQSLAVPDEHLWRARDMLFSQLKQGVDGIIQEFGADNAPPPWQVYQLANQPGKGNVQIVQKVFEGPFEFDILFSSGSAGKDVTSDDLTREIKTTTEAFSEKYLETFTPQTPFNAQKYQKFGRSLLSNLAGGIGYFYGDQIVDRSNAPEYEEENEGFWEDTAEARARHAEQKEGPFELFTSIPSRPFFPRGFLWDEGFHLMPIIEWDTDLTMEIVKSWYNLMDEDGWIAREQILGDEARSKVPAEFQVQYPHYANPPTLFLIIENFLEKLQKANGTEASRREILSQQGLHHESALLSSPSFGLKYLQDIYPLLRRQFYWFKKTQFGDIKSYEREAYSTREGYRWRGRSVQHVLTSGLDDYPRPQPPHPGELHLDLISWVGLMAKTLNTVAIAIGEDADAKDYATVLDNIEHNLVDLHWSEDDQCFCDATIDAFEENQLVCHKGYITLFPFLTGLLKHDDPKLGSLLKIIGDEDELWSPFGLRSLSKKSEFYGTDENYWRSPIWINMNYLAIVQLHVSAHHALPIHFCFIING